MKGMLDYVLVGAVLLLSTGYALCTLGPRPLRQWVRAHTARALSAARLKTLAARINAGASAGACGGCDSCGGEAAKAPAAEIRIPVAKISRRNAH
jgi:hypothetical protein